MDRIKIKNPNKLIDYAKNNTIWTMKYRKETDEAYVFGLQYDSTKVWDQYQINILKKPNAIADMYDDSKSHYYVDMICKDMAGIKKEITNTILFDDLKNVKSVFEHMLDGVYTMEARIK